MTVELQENINLTSEPAQGLQPKRTRNGSISVGSDRGTLRIQFPSKLSQKVWGLKQKYLYLNLPDNDQNRLIAELLVRDILLDIHDSYFDATLERYLNALEAYRPKPLCQEPNMLDNVVNKVLRQHTLSNLFEKYLDYKSDLLEETTLELSYRRRYAKTFSQCPQDLHDGLKIQKYLMKNYCSNKTKRMISVIANMVEWAKLNRLLPASFLNVYKQYREDIKVIAKRETSQTIQELIHSGVIDEPELEFCAFSSKEANAIIEAFEERMCSNNRCSSPWDQVVKFLFFTGCRQGECAGLRWCDVSLDCTKITFRSSYNSRLKILKGLKTEGKGAHSRAFPCGPKLQNLLLSIRPDNYDPLAYVFQNSKGNPIDFCAFHMHWLGTVNSKQQVIGILPTLIKEGKVHQYLTPYSTRHTYINLQLDAGVKVANIAKLVGNSSATIHHYYESSRRDSTQPVEL